ncbi:MAG: DUF3862 domain-containing protein [Pseudomonadota bacterium]
MKKHIQKSVLVLLLIGLAACSKINQDNYNKVENGMTMEQVVAILGEPTEKSGGSIGGLSGSSATWKGEDMTISIQFVNDKVQLKSSSE